MTRVHSLWLVFLMACSAVPPPSTPEVFGEATISVGEVFRGTFAPDGDAFYFFRKVTPGQEDYRIFVSFLRQGQWSAPERVQLGGEYSDLYPSLSRDGRRLVFASYRPVPGVPPGTPDANLWYADRQGEGWGDPVFMAAASRAGHYDAGPEFGPDDVVYFDTTTPDWQTTTAMLSRWNGREYGSAEVFDAVEQLRGFRDGHRVWQGSITRDGTLLFLVVSVVDPATRQPGPSDLWSSRRIGDRWSDPEPLGAGVNTGAGENFPAVTPDGENLVFIRDFRTFYRVSLAAAVGGARR